MSTLSPTKITIQKTDFNQGEEYCALAQGNETGAIVTFVGRVRDFVPPITNPDAEPPINSLWLEHYPTMTETVLEDIVMQAQNRWPILKVRIIHRIGRLMPGDQIVFVGVGSRHRKAAFQACEFIMDFLKTQAPFWKKEGQQWVQAKQSDAHATSRWLDKDNTKS